MEVAEHLDPDRLIHAARLDRFEAGRRAVSLGASVMLEPREGPAGWWSVMTTPEGGEIAFWQTKR